MARNRRNQSAAVRFGPALKALVLCVLIGGAGVGYVWQKNQIGELGRQITRGEQKLQELRYQNDKLRDVLAGLLTPDRLNDRVQRLNLGMALPQANQVWRLTEPVVLPPTVRSAEREIAGSSPTGLAMH